MNLIIDTLIKLGICKDDLDYHFIRASMVVIFFFFGYQKWFEYEAEALIPYISNGPLISWMYPVFGIRGASWFLGVAEWTFGALLFAGFWNKKLGILGALGSCFSFLATITIIPFIPNGWAPSAGGFPAMTETVAFLLKDLVLLAVSVYLLRQDVMRVSVVTERFSQPVSAPVQPDRGSAMTASRHRRIWDGLIVATMVTAALIGVLFVRTSAKPVLQSADNTNMSRLCGDAEAWDRCAAVTCREVVTMGHRRASMLTCV